MASLSTRDQRESRPAFDAAIAELASRQHGLVAYRQLIALGLTDSSIRWRAGSGRLHRVLRGVYAVGHPAMMKHGRYMAAVLACGEEAVVSHRAAAHLLGLGYFPGIEEVTVPRTTKGPAGVVLHTSRTIRDEQRTTFDAIPITSVNRTLVDLADVVRDHRRLAKAVHEADIKQLLDVAVIYPLMNGRRGSRRLKLALAGHRPAELRSGLEFTLHHLLGPTDLPRPGTNVPVEASARSFTVDFIWPEQRLIVEVDGPPHLSKRSFEEDRERDSLLQLAGYRVVRITEKRLRTHSSRVLAELSAHLGL